MRSPSSIRLALATGLLVASASGIFAQEPLPTISPMTSSTRPIAPQTGDVIINKYAAQVLGKALFWDIQAGSDGMACASCHFAAGADIRIDNQINPGPNNKFGLFPDGRPAGPNATLKASDFPLYRLANPDDRNSQILFDTDDTLSSSGTFAGNFIGINDPTDFFNGNDSCDTVFDAANPFHVNGKINRKVEPRQTPTVINAAFNLRQFWDGRANRVFNGVDPFGPRTNRAKADAGVLAYTGSGLPRLQKLQLDYSSLASQAVGPPLSSFEMSCANRKFADIGRKLLPVRPLAGQAVAAHDSLFSQTAGLVATGGQRGLTKTYAEIIKLTFNSRYWSAPGKYQVNAKGAVVASPSGYTQMEQNFPLFFGLALQEYQHTLISGNTRFDTNQLTDAELRGKSVFTTEGKCVECHNGALFTDATAIAGQPLEVIENMKMGDGQTALYDHGFYNIGVRPTSNDLGVGGTDPYGNTLSFSRQGVDKLLGKGVPDNFAVDTCAFGDFFFPNNCRQLPNRTQAASLRVAVDGAFKTPTLRNVGLTPPYHHTGLYGTLEDVVDFYNRGGNRRPGGPCAGGDTSGFGKACSNLDPAISELGLTANQKSDLVAFLKSLTDDRVACQAAPFDHPELPLFMGHNTDSLAQKLEDKIVYLPATGASGLPGAGKRCFPNTGTLMGEMQTAFNQIVNTSPAVFAVRTLTGTARNDTLTGQSGADVFKVSAGSDTYVNFRGGEDKIDLRGTGVRSSAQLRIVVGSTGMQVTLPNNSRFLLQGIGWNQVTDNDVYYD